MMLSTVRGCLEAVGGALALVAKFHDRPAVRLKTLAAVVEQSRTAAGPCVRSAAQGWQTCRAGHGMGYTDVRFPDPPRRRVTMGIHNAGTKTLPNVNATWQPLAQDRGDAARARRDAARARRSES